MKNKLIQVNIQAKFGSKFQEEFFMKCLKLMVTSALIHSGEKHKGNKIIAVMGVDGKPISMAVDKSS